MYKIAFVSGDTFNISSVLRQTIEDINRQGGTIVHILQSQSTTPTGTTILTVTIIYTSAL